MPEQSNDALQSEGWRPISEAPKDGTVVLALLTGGDLPHTIRYVREKWMIAWDAYDLSASCDAPTHFMPLPAPPEGEGV